MHQADMMSLEMPSFAGTHMLGIAGSDHLQHHLQGPKPGDAGLPEIASPISSRPPAAADGLGGFPDDDTALVGEEGDRCVTGNRWPRQETLALLKIRSEMDSAFREAAIKGPLWEDVSRKLAELGYSRNGKKCKEKFENVHKYYKRTKEGRGGRQDGKSYKFFSQLEALHSNNAPLITTTTSGVASIPIVESGEAMADNPVITQQPTAVLAPTQIPERIIVANQTARIESGVPDPTSRISFSSTSGSSSDSEERENGKNLKLKRSRSSSSKMKAFFEGLMKQVVERQEAMQQRFLETIEKRERDRMIREEAWKLQETAKLAQEKEIAVQERAISASRDAAVIAFLQKFVDTIPPPIKLAAAPPPLHHHESRNTEIIVHQPSLSDAIVVTEQPETVGNLEPSSSRWPKSEVQALIKLRSELEFRYLDSGPKGPLWEEISAGMKQKGYNRSAKRCKEKWENINKYFKKVKESNKRRPEDAKTCPYFHQLEALYRKKSLGFGNWNKQEQELNSNQNMQENPESQINHNKNTKESQVHTSNGGQPLSLFEEGGGATEKPEDIMKQERIQQQQEAVMDRYDKMDEPDSDNLDEEEDDDEEDGNTEYKIQYQSRNPGGSTENTTMRPFLAMVHQ